MLSRDSRRVNLRPKAELRALIAVAALTDFEQWGLAAINAAEEVERTAKWLGGKLPPVELGRKEPLTLERLMAGIREGVDIVYLVCHGSLPEGKEAFLLLQDDKGEGAMVPASELARRISELQVDLPRLIVMASCESAGKEGSAQAQHSLAPRLAEAGVPAVVAMQGQISLKTVELAMPFGTREELTIPARQKLTTNRPRVRCLSDEHGLVALSLAARLKRSAPKFIQRLTRLRRG